MKTPSISKFLVLLVIAIFTNAHGADGPNLQDFLTPAQDGGKAPLKLQQPDKIKKSEEQLTKDGKKTTVVEGANIQDAATATAMTLIEEEEDVAVFKAPDGGLGIMARGSATYRPLVGRNASLISKRMAYVQAYLQAKGHLAQYTHGLNVEATQELVSAIDAFDSANDSLANTTTVMNETNQQKVEGLLRGYVIYEVQDDTEKKEVSVTIATTPVTRGATMRVNLAIIAAEDLESGMKQVWTELRSGVVPPVCSRIVCVVNEKGKQDFYFVGFGSSIVSQNRNKDIQRRLGQAAKRQAQLRAASSLLALVKGDQMAWQSGISSQMLDQQKQFNLKGDPMLEGGDSVIPMAKTTDVFQNRMRLTSSYKTALAGKLPPGIAPPKTWYSEDGDWVFAAYVFNPRITVPGSGTVAANQSPPGRHPKTPGAPATGNEHSDCPQSTATTKVIKRTVEAYGHTKHVAVLHGLVEAVQQVNGLSINSAQKMESSIKQFIRETNKESSEEVEISDLTSEQIRTATKGLIAAYNILQAKETEGEWKVSIEVCVYRYVSPSNKKGVPTLVVADFQFAKPNFNIGLAQSPQPLPANQVAARLGQNLVNKLTKAGQYRVLDRRHVLELQKEKGFLIGQNAHLKELVRFGETLGADYVLAGAINDFSQVDIPFFIELLNQRGVNSIASIAVDFRVIEVGTREVIWSDSIALPMGKAELNRLLPQQRLQKMYDVAAEATMSAFLDAISPIKIMKAPNEGGMILLNQGRGRVKVGDTFTVHPPGEAFVDPNNGKQKVVAGDLLAVVQILRVDAASSWGRITEGKGVGIKYGSLCKRARILPPVKKPTDDGTPGIK